MRIKSRVIVADKPNANGVIWPKDVLRRSVENINDDIFLHISESNYKDTDLTKICAKLTEAKIDGIDFIVDFDIVGTPSGGLLKQMIDVYANIGVSMTSVVESVVDSKITEARIIGFNITPLDDKCPHITKLTAIKDT